jgi:HAD superfamily hydrolase (TIGR01549 family)
VETLKNTATRATNAWQAHVRADPTALQVLATLRESKTLALISNFDHPSHAYEVLRETGLDRYFETVVISGEVGVKKPNPEIFRIALRATNLSAEEVVYVGDTQDDVDGAKAAGIRPILIVRKEEAGQPRILDYSREQEQPADAWRAPGAASVITINSLSEIFALTGALTSDRPPIKEKHQDRGPN